MLFRSQGGDWLSTKNLTNFSISRTLRIAIFSVGVTPLKWKSFSVEEALGPRRHMAGSNRNPWRDHSGMGGGITPVPV
jgi:hypothetical protein